MITRYAIAKVTSKGQVTIPVEVRRHLGIEAGDRVSFIVAEDGSVQLDVLAYPTIGSIAGIAGKLDEDLSWDEIVERAHEDQVVERYRKEHLAKQ